MIPRTPPADLFARLPERRERVRFMVPDGDGQRPVTWGAFADEVERVALGLSALGLRPGDRVAVLGQSGVPWFAAALGAQAAHAVMVPIYPASTPEQVAYIVDHSGARALFADPALLAKVAERLDRVEHVFTFGEASHAALLERGAARRAREPHAMSALLESLGPDRPGTMIYTSGTTGSPKGVVLTHANVASNTRDWIEALSPLAKEDMVDVLWLPPSHIFGWGQLCNGNLLGWTSHLATPKDALERLREVRPSVFFSVPAYWEKLAQEALLGDDPDEQRARLVAATGGRLELCLSGGAGLKPRVKELFREAGILIIEGYGLTETSPTLTLNRPDDYRFDSVGKPLASVRLKLADDGEILAKGPNVFAGYHRDPAATQAAFDAEGWFKTGDVGRFTEDGFLRIVDRKKEILVTAGGKNVPPQNIELRFKDDPDIAQLVVYGDGKKYLVAGVWLLGEDTKERRARVAARIAAVNAELASFESIKRFTVLDRPLTVEGGFLTPTLKLRRKKVYEAFGEALEALYA